MRRHGLAQIGGEAGDYVWSSQASQRMACARGGRHGSRTETSRCHGAAVRPRPTFRWPRGAPGVAGRAARRRHPAGEARAGRRPVQAAGRERPRPHPRGGADGAGNGRLRQRHPPLHRGAARASAPNLARTADCASRATWSRRRSERRAPLHAARPGPQARHADAGQPRALRHGGRGGACRRHREARIPRIASCRTSTTPRASST